MNDGKLAEEEISELLGISSADRISLEKRKKNHSTEIFAKDSDDPFSDSEFKEIEDELFALADFHDGSGLSDREIESLLRKGFSPE